MSSSLTKTTQKKWDEIELGMEKRKGKQNVFFVLCAKWIVSIIKEVEISFFGAECEKNSCKINDAWKEMVRKVNMFSSKSKKFKIGNNLKLFIEIGFVNLKYWFLAIFWYM